VAELAGQVVRSDEIEERKSGKRTKVTLSQVKLNDACRRSLRTRSIAQSRTITDRHHRKSLKCSAQRSENLMIGWTIAETKMTA
jgi:hypothetical protein